MQSPPKHRRDGTSPLPLGMDWSFPPKNWNGSETVWLDDSHTAGWSYCVTIPSWVVGDSEPIVFYKVLIGLQSPEGVTTTRYVLKRFSDFLKFVSTLNTAFPRKRLPPAPPKGVLQMKTRALQEGGRRSLEEWITRLLSDIDISQSLAVASFLELEAAVRSSFQDENQWSSVNTSANSTAISSPRVHPNLNLSLLAGSSSVISEYDSKTAYEASDIGTAILDQDNNSEIGIEDDVSSQKGSESPNLAFQNAFENGDEVARAAEVLGNLDMQLPDVYLVLPQDQGQKMNRVLITMQRELATAKTDKEDLISRLNQEIAVKENLTAKVKDLEVELEATKQKSKENIETAILTEKERVTQMQWDMEELRRKSMEMELKLNSEQGKKVDTAMTSTKEKDSVQELDLIRRQHEGLMKQYQEREKELLVHIKILVKSVKYLRSSEAQLKQRLNESLKGKSVTEIFLQEERHKNERMGAACGKLLEECESPCNQLQECNVDILNKEDNQIMDCLSSSDALDHVAKFDEQINQLLAEVERLCLASVVASVATADKSSSSEDVDIMRMIQDLRETVMRILSDNVRLRKKIISVKS